MMTLSPGFEAVDVDLQGGLAVFQGVGHGAGVGGQLAGLAHQDQRLVQVQAQGRAEEEAAGFDGGEGVEFDAGEQVLHPVQGDAEGGRIFHDRRDVLEQDAGLGEVGDGPDDSLRSTEGLLSDRLLEQAVGFDGLVVFPEFHMEIGSVLFGWLPGAAQMVAPQQGLPHLDGHGPGSSGERTEA